MLYHFLLEVSRALSSGYWMRIRIAQFIVELGLDDFSLFYHVRLFLVTWVEIIWVVNLPYRTVI